MEQSYSGKASNSKTCTKHMDFQHIRFSDTSLRRTVLHVVLAQCHRLQQHFRARSERFVEYTPWCWHYSNGISYKLGNRATLAVIHIIYNTMPFAQSMRTAYSYMLWQQQNQNMSFSETMPMRKPLRQLRKVWEENTQELQIVPVSNRSRNLLVYELTLW